VFICVPFGKAKRLHLWFHTKSVLITPLFSKRGGEGEKLAAEVEKGVYEADLVSNPKEKIACKRSIQGAKGGGV